MLLEEFTVHYRNVAVWWENIYQISAIFGAFLAESYCVLGL